MQRSQGNPFPTDKMWDIAQRMEAFEAAESVARTGTGARREGDEFEALVTSFWSAFADHLVGEGASVEITGSSSRRWARLTRGPRSLYLPTRQVTHENVQFHPVPKSWTQLKFETQDLVAAFPGEVDAIRRYAPSGGPFAGKHYPKMYEGLSTKFDDLIILEDSGVLREKILLEYKTAKSSKGKMIDGNAHERLSFQILQYLEIATRYTRCSLVIIANGAFIRYRNKYHVSFHIQADRLANFCWFKMEYLCEVPEYALFVDRLAKWLGGKG